jgi:pyridoxamine 5'-phosphate oxidase
MRKPYNERHTTFTEDSLVAKEPIKQFQSWFDAACQTPNILEANAMCLSTASK